MTGSIIRIRNVAPAMLPALADLHRLAFETIGGRSWTARELGELMASPGFVARVADGLPMPPGHGAMGDNGTTGDGAAFAPAGFVLGRVAADQCEIVTLCVAPARRRQGIGSALIRSAMATLAGPGRRLFLEVAADNDAAIAFYRRLSFVETGRRTAYYRRAPAAGGAGGDAPPVDAIVMARDLPAAV